MEPNEKLDIVVQDTAKYAVNLPPKSLWAHPYILTATPCIFFAAYVATLVCSLLGLSDTAMKVINFVFLCVALSCGLVGIKWYLAVKHNHQRDRNNRSL